MLREVRLSFTSLAEKGNLETPAWWLGLRVMLAFTRPLHGLIAPFETMII